MVAAGADKSLTRHQAGGGRGQALAATTTGRSSQWGDHVGANPVDRGKPGSKLHLVTDGQGLPLTVAVTAANVNDGTMFEGLLDDVPAVRTSSGRRRCRPEKVHADKGYDARGCRAYLRRRGITARIARRRIESSTRLGRHRWRVERALSWLRAELLQALADPLGSGLGAVVCVRAAGLCTHLFQPALARQHRSRP